MKPCPHNYNYFFYIRCPNCHPIWAFFRGISSWFYMKRTANWFVTTSSFSDLMAPYMNATKFEFEDMRGAGEYEAEDYVSDKVGTNG